MYAIITVGDKQFWVGEGDRVIVPRREQEVGKKIEISEVLFIGGNGSCRAGRPHIDGANVTAEVQEHLRGPKVVSFKYRRRKGSKKTIGHRQPLTRIFIEKISA